MTAGGLGLVALVLASPAASAAGRIAIDHAPLECVLYDRYTRITAAGAPADSVADAQLQFRARGDGGWYSVGMEAEGSRWSAYLPRPVRPLARLEYRIVMRSSDAGESSTATAAARVGDEAECVSPGPSSAAVTAPIVVRIPEGAPAVPPVPAGFSPAGVVAVEEPVRKASSLKKTAVGVGVAGGIAAAALLGDSLFEPAREIVITPTFQFSRTQPVPGTAISWRNDQLSVFVLMNGRSHLAADFTWMFELFGEGVETVCLTMTGRLRITTALPATVMLNSPLFARTAACGQEFDVDRSRLRVFQRGQTIHDEVVAPLPFHFEP